ncbi:MAG: DUF4936 family protein [Pigmentiphaga sp.]|nr:DUF4936 family protein [Pigmentiphaga sp.]
MTPSVYIYYKLADAHQEAALAPAQDVLRAGASHARRVLLQRRPDSKEGIATWMEVYEDVTDVPALLQALDQAVARNQLDSYLASPRLAEQFVPLTSDTAFSE